MLTIALALIKWTSIYLNTKNIKNLSDNVGFAKQKISQGYNRLRHDQRVIKKFIFFVSIFFFLNLLQRYFVNSNDSMLNPYAKAKPKTRKGLLFPYSFFTSLDV